MSDEKQNHSNGYDGYDRRQDPTRNTREMVQDAVDRINDLAAVQAKSVTDLADAETRRVNELAALRDRYEEKLSIAEASRLNANRTMDESARVFDREKAAASAALLAADVKSTAEIARALVAQTKEEATKNLDQRLNPILEKIASFEQYQFSGAGERRATDPLQAQMALDVRALLGSKEQNAGRATISTPMLMVISGGIVGFVVFLVEQATSK